MNGIHTGIVKRVLAQYGIEPADLVCVRRKDGKRQVWRVADAKGRHYALKFVNNENTAQRITSVSDYLNQRKVPVVPVLPTKNGNPFVRTEHGCFILFPWLEGQKPSFKSPGIIEQSAFLLARFHEASRGYAATGGPIAFDGLDVHQHYQTKIKRMERLKMKALQLEDPFTELFLSELPWLEACIKWVLDRLPQTSLGQLIRQSQQDPLLGHLDYSVHNLLLGSKNELSIIDLDDVAIALPSVDISNLITWVAYQTNSWTLEKLNLVLTAYQRVRQLAPEEKELILIDQIFPNGALIAAKWHFIKKESAKSSEKLKNCLRMDREKMKCLGMGPS